jgi:hypothetical protein
MINSNDLKAVESGAIDWQTKIMNLKQLLCLAGLVLSMNVQAQELKIHVDKKGKIGYVDQDGNEVIKCQYESAQPFNDGIAIVTKGGKSGIIDTKGTVLLPLKYTQIFPWNKNLYLIKSGKLMGLANHEGKVVLPAKYSLISRPNCYGKALIALGGKATPINKKTYMAKAKYGIINVNGDILVEAKYKGLYEFAFDGKNLTQLHEGKTLSFSNHITTDTLITDCSYLGFSGNSFGSNNAGIMDGNGKEILKPGLYNIVMQPQSGMVRYYNTTKKQTICGYHNLNTGKGFEAAKFDSKFLDINFWTHGDFIGEIAPVNGSSWSFINNSGTTVRTGYSSLKHSIASGLWAAKNNTGTWDVFDDYNRDVASLSGYEEIEFPSFKEDKQIFSVKKDGKFGCITRSGDIKVPFEFEKAYGNIYDIIAVLKDGKWGIVSPENSELIPTAYAGIVFPSERNAKHLWVTKDDSLFYHYNLQTNQIATTGYKRVDNFKDGIAHVAPTDMIVDNTPLNRAQLFIPNADKTAIDNIDASKNIDKFGYLINENDEVLMDIPVSVAYKELIVKEIQKRNGRALTSMEKKNILLEATRENRSYDLNATLSKDEWNY